LVDLKKYQTSNSTVGEEPWLRDSTFSTLLLLPPRFSSHLDATPAPTSDLFPPPLFAGDVLLMDITGRSCKREIAKKVSIPYVLAASDAEAETAAIEVIGFINGRKRMKIALSAVLYGNSHRGFLSGQQRCSGHSSLPRGECAIYQ